jgi:tetratricopeptide (TPR) repeat protein
MSNSAALLVLPAILAGFVLWPAAAQAGNRDSEIEKLIAGEFRTGVEQPPDVSAPGKPGVSGEDLAPRENAAKPEPAGAKSPEQELAEAHKEIARLQDIVKRIVEANRREKVDMHYNVGCILRSGGQYLKAEQEFLKALALAPDDADVHYNIGILYEENLKNPKKAREHYERYIELAPSRKDAAKVRQWLTEMGM